MCVWRVCVFCVWVCVCVWCPFGVLCVFCVGVFVCVCLCARLCACRSGVVRPCPLVRDDNVTRVIDRTEIGSRDQHFLRFGWSANSASQRLRGRQSLRWILLKCESLNTEVRNSLTLLFLKTVVSLQPRHWTKNTSRKALSCNAWNRVLWQQNWVALKDRAS